MAKDLNFCHKYWAPFIKHEISVVSGIRWYITNLLLRAAKASSVDQVDIFLQSEPITSYVNDEAIRIYQTCYHVAKYYTFLLKSYKSIKIYKIVLKNQPDFAVTWAGSRVRRAGRAWPS